MKKINQIQWLQKSVIDNQILNLNVKAKKELLAKEADYVYLN